MTVTVTATVTVGVAVSGDSDGGDGVGGGDGDGDGDDGGDGDGDGDRGGDCSGDGDGSGGGDQFLQLQPASSVIRTGFSRLSASKHPENRELNAMRAGSLRRAATDRNRTPDRKLPTAHRWPR